MLWCLCLHGKRQTAEIFQHQLTALEKELAIASSSSSSSSSPCPPLSFVYLEAPHELSKMDDADAVATRSWSCAYTPPSSRSRRRHGREEEREMGGEDYTESDRLLDAALQAHPYTFVLGFSQGALLLARCVARHGGRIPTGGKRRRSCQHAAGAGCCPSPPPPLQERGKEEGEGKDHHVDVVQALLFVSAPNVWTYTTSLSTAAPHSPPSPPMRRVWKEDPCITAYLGEHRGGTETHHVQPPPPPQDPSTTSSSSHVSCGFLPSSLPSLHVMGEKDGVIPMEESLAFAHCCGAAAEVYRHPHAHGIPHGKTNLKGMVTFMKKVALLQAHDRHASAGGPLPPLHDASAPPVPVAGPPPPLPLSCVDRWKEAREEELTMVEAMCGEGVVTRYTPAIPVMASAHVFPLSTPYDVALTNDILSHSPHGETTEGEPPPPPGSSIAATHFRTIAAILSLPIFGEDVWDAVHRRSCDRDENGDGGRCRRIDTRVQRWLRACRVEVSLSPVYPGVPFPTAVRVWCGGGGGGHHPPHPTTPPVQLPASHDDTSMPHSVPLEQWRRRLEEELMGYFASVEMTPEEDEDGSGGSPWAVLPFCVHVLSLASSMTTTTMGMKHQKRTDGEEEEEEEEGVVGVIQTLAAWLTAAKNGGAAAAPPSSSSAFPHDANVWEERSRAREGRKGGEKTKRNPTQKKEEEEVGRGEGWMQEEDVDGAVRMTRAVEADKVAWELLQRSMSSLFLVSSSHAETSTPIAPDGHRVAPASGGGGEEEGWGGGGCLAPGARQGSRKGRWKLEIGLLGKPSAGKSTFFNAITDPEKESETAAVAAFPFTTISPHTGMGYGPLCVCPCTLGGDSGGGGGPMPRKAGAAAATPSSTARQVGWCTAAYGHVCAHPHLPDYRRFPIRIKDVAGLVKGAYQGRGKGNQFLHDLCEADVLVHVVDGAGATAEDGTMCPVGEGSTLEDIAWVRAEVHFWMYDNLASKWESIYRQPQRFLQMFSGYGSGPAFVGHVLRAMGISTTTTTIPTGSERVGSRPTTTVPGSSSSSPASRPPPPNPAGGIGSKRHTTTTTTTSSSSSSTPPPIPLEEAVRQWGRRELHVWIAFYIRCRFPIIVALNKMDLAPPQGGAEPGNHTMEAVLKQRYPEERCIPMSAGVEWDLLQLRKRQVVQYVSGSTSFDLLPLRERETRAVSSSEEGHPPCGRSVTHRMQEDHPSGRPTTTTPTCTSTRMGSPKKEEEEDGHSVSPSFRGDVRMPVERGMEEEEEETRQALRKGLQRAIRFFRGEKTEDRARLPSEGEAGGATHEKKETKTGEMATSSFSSSITTISSIHSQPITTGVQSVLAAALAAFPTTVILPVLEDWRSFFSSFPAVPTTTPTTTTTSTTGGTTTPPTTPSWHLPHTLCYRYGTMVETVFTSMEHMGLVDGKLVRFEVLPVRALERFYETHSSPPPPSSSSSLVPSENVVENSRSGGAALPHSMRIPEEHVRKCIVPMRRTEVLPHGVLLVRVLTNKFQRRAAGKKMNGE